MTARPSPLLSAAHNRPVYPVDRDTLPTSALHAIAEDETSRLRAFVEKVAASGGPLAVEARQVLS